LFLFIVLSDNFHGGLKLFTGIFFLAALLSLISSLYPHRLEADAILYSDGMQIINALRLKEANKYLFKAAACFDGDDFAGTLAELDKINKAYMNDYICSLYIQCYVELKQYQELTAFRNTFITSHFLATLTSNDCINLSFANIQLKEYDEALRLLNRAVELNEDYYALNNRGFVLNILGDYAAAKQDLNKACEIDPISAYAVTNRAYSNVKLGLLDEALVDINKSMELNDGNSYIYLVQGMYQLETGDPQNALANFETAKNLNSTTVLVDEYITLAKSRIIAAQV
jgi:tetratricopeptide (TPR) repeat protein